MLKQGSLQKSNGRLEQWDDSKLIKAVNKAAARAGETIDFDKLIPLVNKSTSVSELYHKLMGDIFSTRGQTLINPML